MPPLKPFAAILPLVMLSACATAERPKTVTDTACTAFHAITYAQLAKGLVDDAGNKADTLETVNEIRDHNSRYDALCTGK